MKQTKKTLHTYSHAHALLRDSPALSVTLKECKSEAVGLAKGNPTFPKKTASRTQLIKFSGELTQDVTTQARVVTLAMNELTDCQLQFGIISMFHCLCNVSRRDLECFSPCYLQENALRGCSQQCVNLPH